MHHERTQYVDVKYHFIRKVVAEGSVIVKKVSTEDSLADMFTKALPAGKFQHCLKLLNVVESRKIDQIVGENE